MNADVLMSKLLVPPPRAGTIARRALLGLLDAGLEKRLTLVSAPAGYGKTTLLGAWVRARRLRAAWVSLDEADNDLARFLRYLLAALRGVGAIPSAGEEATGLPAFAGSVESFRTWLVNHLHADQGRMVIVLDDYHLISNPAVHQFVEFLVEQLPPQARLALATRADPPLPLARLRARGDLLEIRLAQLRFTGDEAGAFLQAAGEAPLAPEDVQALNERVEGWPAGLQMASLSLRGRADRHSYLRAFTGGNRYILDYLVEEVLDRQPEDVQAFLLRTSILERLSAELCDEVIGSGEWRMENGNHSPLPTLCSPLSTLDSSSILDHLDRSNLFLVALDDRREWYRYHHLFADLLRKRLEQLHPGLAPELHRRASSWFERSGWASEAIEHALAAGDVERAAGLIEATAEAALLRGESATLLGWLRRLPEALIWARPRLDLYQVAAQALTGQGGEGLQSELARLEQHADLRLETGVVRAFLALFLNEIGVVEDLTQQALQGLPREAVFFRGAALWMWNHCQVSASGLEQRAEILAAQLQFSQATGNRMVWASSLCNLAETRYRQGNLRLAGELYRQVIQTLVGADGRPLPVAGEALVGLGHLEREWNELDASAEHIQAGIALAQQMNPYGAIEGWMALSLCRQAQGDPRGAREAMGKAREIAGEFAASQVDDVIVDYYEAVLLLQQGDTQAMERYFERKAARQAAAFTAQPEDQAPWNNLQAHLEKYEQVSCARACLVSGDLGQALEMLDRVLPEMQAQGRVTLVIEIELLRALALRQLNRLKAAQAAFEKALRLAEPGGFVRLFVAEGRPVAELLRQALRNGVCADYAARLLRAFPGDAGESVASRTGAQSVDALSLRELEVLRLLAQGGSAKEIAAQLSVAESTVQSHVKAIYAKLGAHRKVEALRRARELGLIAE